MHDCSLQPTVNVCATVASSCPPHRRLQIDAASLASQEDQLNSKLKTKRQRF